MSITKRESVEGIKEPNEQKRKEKGNRGLVYFLISDDDVKLIYSLITFLLCFWI